MYLNALIGRHRRDQDLTALASWVLKTEDLQVGVQAVAAHDSRFDAQLPIRSSHDREWNASVVEARPMRLTDNIERLGLDEAIRNRRW